VCASTCRSVGDGFALSSGTQREIGSSRSSRFSAASFTIAAAVNVFVTE